MTKQRLNNKKKSSLKMGVLFLASLTFLLTVSIVLKSVDTVRKSTFDGKNRYIASITREKDILALSFLPSEGKAAVLKIIESQSPNLGRDFGIPVDAEVSNLGSQDDGIKTNLKKILFTYPRVKTNMTILDAIRLNFYAFSLSEGSIDKNSIYSTDKKIDLVAIHFSDDPQIVNEKKTIEVINATGEEGLATRLSRVLTNMGANVVLLKNSKQISKKSFITYTNNEGYTLKRLATFLGLEKEKTDKTQIADIVITLGQDCLKSDKF